MMGSLVSKNLGMDKCSSNVFSRVKHLLVYVMETREQFESNSVEGSICSLQTFCNGYDLHTTKI
ncbi:protein of unknown function [Candidatus Nitrosotalea okcheonensis]|uniref:Uncharacterized protein n=1 Tax=Candidatus Nitrosotalea okcheonensis TaxID=1903276 RepID=A0A2H1FEK6_9ARCH|nr:protein of unknown function [Candidatus Nitrosotalea okcheonensis]